ncbi:hypothetical protein IKH79_02980 [Candidatus Saccharibacteria bacterium]|nr:hypothetical protein [Candidatus Saccharibacteria bacterium]
MKKGLALIGVGLAAVVAVFVLAAVNRVDYGGAKEQTAKIVATRGAVEEFLDAKEFEQGKADAFEAAVSGAREALGKLAESSATKDGRVKESVEAAQGEFAKIEKLNTIWGDAKLLQDLSDQNLAKLKNSESEFLKKLAGELIDYRKKLADYKAKYGSGKEQSTELLSAFSEIWNEGEELETKAGKASLEEISGMSRDDITVFYAKIEELNKYLAEK